MNPSNPNSGAYEFVEDLDWTLAPWRAGNFVIGAVDEVNGHGALAVSGFVPSRRELLVLYAYWEKTKLDSEFFWFAYEHVGSTERRIRAFASLRMARIEEALGDDPALEATIQEVETKFSANIPPLVWKVFTGRATEKERREFEAMDNPTSAGTDWTQDAGDS